jgi:stalled ribosome rescue protein Dom34
MENYRRIGIWMDHAEAHLMELIDETITKNKIMTDFTSTEREESLSRSEHIMHHKEQQLQHEYYTKIAESIKEFGNVVIFGPTTAKNELYNLLKSDPHFENIRIEVKSTDKLTEHQQEAFVKHHFQYQLK